MMEEPPLTSGGTEVLALTIDLGSIEEVPASWMGCLSAEERVRIARFIRPQDRVSTAAAHCLKRLLLGRALTRNPQDLVFSTIVGGKPVVMDEKGPASATPSAPLLEFSLSHTDGMAALAMSRFRPVGIDVEAVDRRPVEIDLIHRALGAEAASRLGRLKGLARQRAFLAAWTIREAAAKADGRGLSLDPEALRPMSGGRLAVEAPGGTIWQIRSLPLGHAHLGAVAASPAQAIRCLALTPVDLSHWAEASAHGTRAPAVMARAS